MIYIHVPFCKSRCHYCDFFSSTSSSLQTAYVQALEREMQQRRPELLHARANTLYIGGGTPSQLSPEHLQHIFHALSSQLQGTDAMWSQDSEITIEVNPDDVTPDFVRALSQTPVNRVSMGVQSLDDNILRLIGRRHDSAQAARAVSLLRQAGYENLSLDLMYGLPTQTMDQWQSDVDTILTWRVPHLSAYSLQWEEGTALWHKQQEGLLAEADEELSLRMYTYLMDTATDMEHYEISNFAMPGYRSRHNSGYWRNAPYAGLGPGAHSYDGERHRTWNESSLQAYISGQTRPEGETLSDDELYDELIMKRLRTSDGLPVSDIPPTYRQYTQRMAQPHISAGRLSLHDGTYRLTRKGLFVSNDIMSDLML